MEDKRPRGRERHVSGPGKTVEKHGQGLGTGPVGDAGGYADRKPQDTRTARSAGTRSGGGMKLIVLLLAAIAAAGILVFRLQSRKRRARTAPPAPPQPERKQEEDNDK